MDMYIASKKSFAIMAFPSNDAKNVKDYEAHEYKVFTAFTLSQAYKSSAAVFVQVACKPRYAVTTLKSYKKEDLELLPFTRRVNVVKLSERDPSACEVKTGLKNYAIVLMSDCSQDSVVPAWLMSSTADEDDATMTLKYKAFELETWSGKMKIEVPYYVNKKALKKGDECIIYKEKKKEKEKAKRTIGARADGPAPKAARILSPQMTMG